jgi:hypothetical protein
MGGTTDTANGTQVNIQQADDSNATHKANS